MKRLLSRIFLAIGAITAVAALMALITPRTTHAFVAALVQVANTSANPVPVIDVAAQQPFQAACFGEELGSNRAECSVAVPAGKRLVLQMVSLKAVVDSTNSPLESSVTITNQGSGAAFSFDLAFVSTFADEAVFTRTQLVTAYSDPGSTVICAVADAGTNKVHNFIACTLTGFLVNQ